MSGLFEILATVVIEFTASPHSAFIGDFVRLWSLHHMRPFALAAMEGINNRNVSLAVRNDCSYPSHSNSMSRSDATVLAAASLPAFSAQSKMGQKPYHTLSIGMLHLAFHFV